MVEPSQFDCAICQNLLLDPVVGPCGHDFCKSCLWRWKTSSTRGAALTCPLCREPIPGELGVCVRLRETIQLLFPDKVKERRGEVQERILTGSLVGNPAQQAAGASTTQRIQPPGRTSSAESGSYTSTLFLHASRSISRPATRTASSVHAATATPAVAVGSATAPNATDLPSSVPLDTWVPPATLCFTLGWHDPAETRRRRSLGRRRRVLAA